MTKRGEISRGLPPLYVSYSNAAHAARQRHRVLYDETLRLIAAGEQERAARSGALASAALSRAFLYDRYAQDALVGAAQDAHAGGA